MYTSLIGGKTGGGAKYITALSGEKLLLPKHIFLAYTLMCFENTSLTQSIISQLCRIKEITFVNYVHEILFANIAISVLVLIIHLSLTAA